MAWSDSFRFRDCPWCGVKEAQFRIIAGPGLKVETTDGTRWWTVVACPRCGSPVSLRHNDPDHAEAKLIAAFPDKRRESDVRHLPEGVVESYREAIGRWTPDCQIRRRSNYARHLSPPAFTLVWMWRRSASSRTSRN